MLYATTLKNDKKLLKKIIINEIIKNRKLGNVSITYTPRTILLNCRCFVRNGQLEEKRMGFIPIVCYVDATTMENNKTVEKKIITN